MSFWPENICAEIHARGIRAAILIIGMDLVLIINEYNIFIFIVNLIKSVSYY